MTESIASRLHALIEGWGSLSPAERTVALHVVDGQSNKEIALILNRSEATIKNQVASVLRRTNQPSRTRLIARWHQAWIFAGEENLAFPDILPPSIAAIIPLGPASSLRFPFSKSRPGRDVA